MQKKHAPVHAPVQNYDNDDDDNNDDDNDDDDDGWSVRPPVGRPHRLLLSCWQANQHVRDVKGGLNSSRYQKTKALEGWYRDPTKRLSNL